MFEVIFGSRSMEKVLFYLYAKKKGYAREIALFYDTDLTPVQNQLNKLEQGGVLISRQVGKTRVFEFNLRYPFLKELKSLIRKGIEFLPESEREKLTIYRKRPRRKGKP